MIIAPHVGLIIPNWNGAEHIEDLMESLSFLNYPKESMEIVIVDNGSEDNSIEEIEHQFKRMKDEGWIALKILRNKNNEGAPAAYNRAIRACAPDCEYYFKLDNDIVLDKECLKILVKEMSLDKRIGAISPKIYFYNDKNRLNFAGGSFNKALCVTKHIGMREIDIGQYDEKKEVDFLTGCATLLSRKCFEEVGGFNEKYFWYYDELDFIYRAKLKGWKIIYIPVKGAWHKIEGRQKEISLIGAYYFNRNRLYFAWNNCRPYFAFVFIASLRNLLINLVRLRQDFLKIYLTSYKDFFMGKMGEKK